MPDVRIGRVFDRNWELLSAIAPVWAVRGMVRRHFAGLMPRLIYQNISRLSAQWEGSILAALESVEREARRRLEDLAGTVKTIIAAPDLERTGEMRADLERIQHARQTLRGLR